jgi:uncharacterized membrane protein YfcA
VRLVAIGLAAGILSGLFGVGGGLVIVPLLVLVVGFEQRVAAATSLAAIGLIAAAGVAVFAVAGKVEPTEGMLVGVPAALGAWAGAALQQRLTNRVLSLLFAALLAGLGVRFVLA